MEIFTFRFKHMINIIIIIKIIIINNFDQTKWNF